MCQKWKAARYKHGSRCNECHHTQQHPSPDPPAAAASAPPPLFPPHTGNHAPLTTVQRAAIVVLDKQGLPHTEVAQQAGTSLPTVRHWLKHYEEKKDVADEPRSGRPRSTDEAMDTAIVGESYNDHYATPKQLKRKLELDVSTDTIDRRLKEAGLPGRVARHVFELTPEHKRQRMSFAH
ncbi:MAG: helix-turn-helix domain-containing protein, partial [Acidobacteriaceae bacterium]|nr:helix-turn-helix domain-containing protein [Acidobacteriaceae bacterium]